MKIDNQGRAQITKGVLEISKIEKGDELYVSFYGDNSIILKKYIQNSEISCGKSKVDDKARIVMPYQVRQKFNGMDYVAEGKYNDFTIILRFYKKIENN